MQRNSVNDFVDSKANYIDSNHYYPTGTPQFQSFPFQYDQPTETKPTITGLSSNSADYKDDEMENIDVLIERARKELEEAKERTRQLEEQLEEERRVLEKLEEEMENTEHNADGEVEIENRFKSANPPNVPLLTVSGNGKLYKYKSFKLHLYVNTAWRQQYGLSSDQIYQICSKVICAPEGTTNPIGCQHCSANTLITFGVASPQTFAAERISDSVERFTFDSCRSNCSSSRDHLKTRLTAVIFGLPEFPSVQSSSFVMQAREKNKKPVTKEPELMQKIDPATFTNQILPVITAVQSDYNFDQKLDPNVIDPKVTVHVICTTLQNEQVTALCNHFHQTVLKSIPGLLSFDAKIITGLTILFTLYTTEESSLQLTKMTKDYITNAPGTPNLFGTDLQAQKTFAILGVFTSWNY